MAPEVRALYFPYSLSFDMEFIKQSLLLFDRLLFVSPFERAVRESIVHGYQPMGLAVKRTWKSIKDDYDYLDDEQQIEFLSPFSIVRPYDGLMAQAMISDLEDPEFLLTASEMAARDYWGILKGKVPPGTLMENALLSWKTRFWEDPRSIRFPPGRTAGRRELGYGGYQDFSSPFIMSVAHDYLPVSCGYSVNTNLALLVSEIEHVALVTDDPTAVRLLKLKHQRAANFEVSQSKRASVSARQPSANLQSYGVLAATIAETLLPTELISSKSVQQIVRFKRSEHEAFARFKSLLFELTAHLNAKPWTKEHEREVVKLIDSKILPESQRVRDQLKVSYEKMFGSVVQKAASAVTPTVVASFLAGLSSGQILALSTAAGGTALSIALPELVELWKERKGYKRSSLNFLLRL